MNSEGTLFRLGLFILGLLLGAQVKVQAQTYESRAAFTQEYIKYKKEFSLFQAPPITHLVPTFNTITYALSYDKLDTKITPSTDGQIYYSPTIQESLHLTGYSFAPHLAMSLKMAGIGFSLENSKQQSAYTYDSTYTGGTIGIYSVVESSGVGFNFSFLPIPKLRKDYKLAVIIGGKSLNVRHRWTNFVGYNGDVLDDSDYRSTRYSLTRYEAGVNFTMRLLKHFAVIPWADYSHNDLRDAKAAVVDNSPPGGEDLSYQIYQDDVLLFWDSSPKMRYGLDLAVRAMNLELRLGSLIGSLGSLNSTPDNIEDKSFTLSLSFDQKGN